MTGDRLTDAELKLWLEILCALADPGPTPQLTALHHYEDQGLGAFGRLLREVVERRADDSRRAWVDAGAPMLGEDAKR